MTGGAFLVACFASLDLAMRIRPHLHLSLACLMSPGFNQYLQLYESRLWC